MDANTGHHVPRHLTSRETVLTDEGDQSGHFGEENNSSP